MSTKIWTAYKLRRANQLWPFLRDARRTALDNVKAALRKLYLNMMSEVQEDSEEFKKAKDNPYMEMSDEKARFEVVDQVITEGYQQAMISPYRDLFNFDVSLTFREFEGGYYIIPHSDMVMRDVWKFLATHKMVRDYHYQNQTDQPKEISNRAWNERKRVWDGIDDAGWTDSLTLHVCEYETFYLIKPMGLASLAQYGVQSGDCSIRRGASQPARRSGRAPRKGGASAAS